MSFADLVDIVIAFFFIIVMIFSALWTYFFSLLGLSNFIDKYGKLWGFVGALFWCLLVAAHFFYCLCFLELLRRSCQLFGFSIFMPSIFRFCICSKP